LSLELNYPIPVGNNFVGKNYNGIIDIGADYRVANLNPVNIGVSLNSGFLLFRSRLSTGVSNLTVSSYMIQTRIFGELDLESIDKFHPSVGLGYAIMVFDASENYNGSNVSEISVLSGFNFNFGFAYDITEKLFVQA
jgi:hypothetical protein